MEKIDMFYVQIFGPLANKAIVSILREDTNDLIAHKNIVGKKEKIKTYMLQPKQMMELWENHVPEHLNINVYYLTDLGLVFVKDVSQSLAMHGFQPKTELQTNSVVQETEKRLAEVMARRKPPGVATAKKLQKFAEVQQGLLFQGLLKL